MSQRLRELLERHARLYAENDLHGIAEDFAQPLIVYVATKSPSRVGETSALDLMFAMRAASIRAGAPDVEWRLIEEPASREGRFPVLVEWRYLRPGGTPVASSRIRYFCSIRPDGRLIVEMLEYLRPAFPEALQSLWRKSPKH